MWGDSANGRLWREGRKDYKPVKIIGNIKAVSLGDSHSAAIDNDNNLLMWGVNGHGQLGLAKETDVPQILMGNIKAVSLGSGCSAAIDTSGNLLTWGWNNYGMLGNGTTEDCYSPKMICENVRIKAVRLGTYHSAAIDENGNLWMWGRNNYGQLGDRTIEDCYTPKRIMTNVKAVSLGEYSSCAIDTDDNLWMYGSNHRGELGNGTIWGSGVPIKIMENVKDVRFGESHSATISNDNILSMWGSNDYGQLGSGTDEDSFVPSQLMKNVKSVSLGGDYSATIDNDNNLWMWGHNNCGQLGDGTKESSSAPKIVRTGVKSVSLGVQHSAAIDNDGNLWMWGDNSFGQLGDALNFDGENPKRILKNVKIQAVSLGYYHSAAIDTDGNLWMWGYNYYGQLGNGKTESSSTPEIIMSNVIAISTGGNHSAAIDTDGNLWMWGQNTYGQLGNNKNDSCNKPIQVNKKVKVKAVSLGEEHSAAIDINGNLWTWGRNWLGQLGNGTSEDSSTPIKIMEKVRTVSLGGSKSAAINDAGELFTWGDNGCGELGTIAYEGSAIPIMIKFKDESETNIKNTQEQKTSGESMKHDNSYSLSEVAADNVLTSVADVRDGKASFSGLDAGKIYNFYAVKNKAKEDVLSADNLLYMAQGMTDGTGALSFDYVPREEAGNPELFVVAARKPVRKVSVNGINLDEAELSMKKGETKQLIAAVLPEDATNKAVKWSSSDTSTLIVDENGKVMAVGEGLAYITAETVDGEYPAFCYINVKGEGGEDKPDQPDKPDVPDDEEGIQSGDLPTGAEVPDGVWIGGLKKSYPYTGNAIEPEVRVYYKDKRLSEGVDYTLGYKKNMAVGTGASITVKCKGDFKGSKTVNFAIEKNPLTGVSYEESNLTVAKNGRKHNNVKPVLMMDGVKLKYSKNDFELKYLDSAGQESDCKEAGTYTIRMTAKSSSKGYSGYIDVPLTVTDKTAMGGVTVTASKKSLPYTGEKQMPTFTLKYNKQPLAAGTYSMVELDGDDYTTPGSHTVIFKGNGTDVIGSRRFTYKITGKRALGNNKLTVVSIAPAYLDPDGKVPYANGGAKPKVLISYNGIRLKEGRDYTLSYTGNAGAGSSATVTAKGKGKYAGSVPVNFTISQRDLASLVLTVGDRAESAKADDYKKAAILFTDDDFTDQKLKSGRDYTAEFNVASGSNKPVAGDTVTVLFKAKNGGNYKGQAAATFNIIEKSKDISRAKVKVNNGKAYEYTGKAIEPATSELNVTLGGKQVNTSDYEIVAYYNNVKRSNNAYIIIKGKGGLSGMQAVKFKIGVSPLEKFWRGLIGE